MRILLILLISLLYGCGDSPFVDSAAQSNQVQARDGLSTALSFPQSRYQVELRWQEGPIVYDEGLLTILITSPDGKLKNLPTGSLKLRLWMPSMGHGSYPISLLRISPGIYQASEIFFTMPGDWDLHIEHIQDNVLIEEVIARYDL